MIGGGGEREGSDDDDFPGRREVGVALAFTVPLAATHSLS